MIAFTDGPPAIDVRALSKLHGAVPTLLDVSFTVKPLEFVGVAGAPGAGRTTLLKLLAGHLSPSGGRVRVFGFDHRLSRLAADGLVGYVPQQRLLRGDMSVQDLLAFTGRARRIDPQILDRRLADVVDAVGLGAALDQTCERLPPSGQVRVALGQALMHRPSLLLLDDPLAGLSAGEEEQLVALLQRLNGETTIVMSLDWPRVDRLPAARILRLEHGRLRFDGHLSASSVGAGV
ncbi:MAG TPA: ATP-binding cassette domain-containing protein [Vicinamibacterales bacterium]|nr:ATP-binding cassette domain-containing protein [Vicinamibacterales bacterium]